METADSPVLKSVLAAAKVRGEELLPLLQAWCAINSFTANVAGVNAVGDRLADALDLPGLSQARRFGRRVGDHLFWSTPAWNNADPKERVLLIGHHDTVFPPDTFEIWEHEGDRISAPGVLDMKGGLAVCRTVLAALSDVGVLATLPVGFVSVGDEETSSLDSAEYLREIAAGAGCALVFESGRAHDQIITRRKGTGRVVVEVTGKAAHAGNNLADGINAIIALARVVDRLAELGDPATGVTINVGTIRGGESVNTVPAQAEAVADFRFERAEDGRALFAAAERIAAEVAARSGAQIVIKGGIRRPPLERTEASVALFQAYAACATVAGLGAAECPLLGGGSDASTVAAIGVPAIDGLGPRGTGFHTHDEQIVVSSLAPKVEALVRFLLRTTVT